MMLTELFFAAARMAVLPAVILVLGALALPLLPRAHRSFFFLAFPLLALYAVWALPGEPAVAIRVMDYQLILFQADSLSRVFGTVFSLIVFIGGIYAFHLRDTGQQSTALLYAAGALGVTFAGDYFTLFIFWEIMAVASTFLVWARRTPESGRAGMRYLLMHVFGGGLLFAGILLYYLQNNSLLLEKLLPDGSAAAWFIMAGVALNAAVPPLHAWLTDAYPKATVTGAVFMSALTTKTAVYVLIRLFPGWEILLYLGVMMALYGVVFAVLANDIREILAYHIVSQVGYMVAGVGIGTEMALNGSTAHAFSHILYKALLFMGAGAVLQTTGKSKLTELGGLAKSQPLMLWLYMIGAFSISGFPLFNGFISKSMVVAAAGEAHYGWAVLLLLLASMGTFLHTGLKLPYFTWYAEDRCITPLKAPKNMLIGMALAAFLCMLYGVMPSLLYRILPYSVDYRPYTIAHLAETTQILIFTFVGFWVLREKLAGTSTITLDTDWFYRWPARPVRRYFVDTVDAVFSAAETFISGLVRSLAAFRHNPAVIFSHAAGRQTFNPDFYRPATQFLIVAVLLVFVILAAWGLLAAGKFR
ncbi:MAG: Na(+)/H(+) antiporter subunit D [Kiritimatiellae bacterium]|nr:Na(+)/H(+) antiporter subunit D [Kiritimatiellia bacterium]